MSAGKSRAASRSRIAAGVGAVEIGGVGGRQIDDPIVNRSAETTEGAGRSGDLESRELHQLNDEIYHVGFWPAGLTIEARHLPGRP